MVKVSLTALGGVPTVGNVSLTSSPGSKRKRSSNPCRGLSLSLNVRMHDMAIPNTTPVCCWVDMSNWLASSCTAKGSPSGDDDIERDGGMRWPAKGSFDGASGDGCGNDPLLLSMSLWDAAFCANAVAVTSIRESEVDDLS